MGEGGLSLCPCRGSNFKTPSCTVYPETVYPLMQFNDRWLSKYLVQWVCEIYMDTKSACLSNALVLFKISSPIRAIFILKASMGDLE